MAAEDGLKAQMLLAQSVWDVAYDTPFWRTCILEKLKKSALWTYDTPLCFFC